jgi:hypothetical protein
MSDLDEKEKKLEHLKLDEEIAETQMSIAQKKAVEREMKQKFGRDWKKILGIKGGINKESLQTMYSMNPDLKDLNRPGNKLKKLK